MTDTSNFIASEPSPGNTKIPNLLQYQQGSDVSPAPEGFDSITNPLNPLLRAGSRLAHFADGVYDLSAESHLMRLLKTLLGESGVGGIQRSLLMARLQQSLSSTHFFDLDSFYGAVFGARRQPSELIEANPYVEVLPASEWDRLRIRDGAFRARVSRLSSAIHLGATPGGIEATAEALTGVEFDLVETWQYGSYQQYTHDDWDGELFEVLETRSWDQLEFGDDGSLERMRNVITLYPHEPLTEGERFDLERALDRIKPAHMIVLVSDDVVDVDIDTLPIRPSSTSEKWEIRQLIQNNRINGILPYPDYAEGEFIEPPQSAFGGYSGEAWTVLDRAPRTAAYSTPSTVASDVQIDPLAVDTPPQPLLTQSGATQSVSMPEFGLKPVQGLYSGRSVSDGISATNPFEYRPGAQSGLFVDRIPSEYLSEQLVSTVKLARRFWTSPVRPYDSTVNEVLEIRFSEPVSINHISFEYARFPCSIDVQIWDRGTGAWVTVSTTTNRQSSPYGIGIPPRDAPHPYHWGAEHWAKASISMDPVSSRFFRFVGRRIEGDGPVGIEGTRIPYPLGLRDIDLGYRVNATSKIPHVPATSPVASSRNILGLQSRYYLKRERATAVADASPITAWVSEPQPMADAVVNLYLGLSQNGIPQVANQVFVDPVYTGVVCNLYYTSRVPTGLETAEPEDDVVVPVEFRGNVVPQQSPGGLRFGGSDSGAVVIDARPLGGDSLSGQWWFGVEWTPLTGDLSNSQLRPIVSSALGDTPFFLGHVVADPDEEYVVFAVANGQMARVVFTDYLPAPGQTIRAVVGISSTGAPTLRVVANGAVEDSASWDPSNFTSGPYAAPLANSFVSTFDPVRYEYPDGANLQSLRSRSIYLTGSEHEQATHLTWKNLGTAGDDYDIDFGSAVHMNLTRPAIRLPGTDANHLRIATFPEQAQTDSIAMSLHVALDEWTRPGTPYSQTVTINSPVGPAVPGVDPPTVYSAIYTNTVYSRLTDLRVRKFGGGEVIVRVNNDIGAVHTEQISISDDGVWYTVSKPLLDSVFLRQTSRIPVGTEWELEIYDDGGATSIEVDFSFIEHADPQTLVSRWESAIGEASWRWMIDDEGYMYFESSNDGSDTNIERYYCQQAIDLPPGSEIHLALIHNTNDLGDSSVWFFTSTDGTTWGKFAPTVFNSGIHTRHDGSDIRIGVSAALGGYLGARGLVYGYSFYSDITAPADDATSVTQLGPTADFVLDSDDYLGAWNWSGGSPTFVAQTGQTVTVLRSLGTGNTIDSNSVVKVLRNDTFTEARGMSTDGTGVNMAITALGQNRALNLVGDFIIEKVSSAATFLPIVTKKADATVASRGWGIYAENDNFHLLISDGSTQHTATLQITGGADKMRGRRAVIAVVAQADGSLDFSVRLTDHSVLSTTVAAASIPSGSLVNSLPLRVFADDTSDDMIGCVSLLAVDTTPGVRFPDTIGANVFSGTDVASVGSSWIVERDGAFGSLTLTKGDRLFIVPTSAMPVHGSTSESMQTTSYMVVPVGMIAYGSSALGQIGSDILLSQSAVGYGPRPLAFLDAPTPYCRIPRSNVHTAHGTFLRFHWEYIGWDDGDVPSVGFMGGTPNAWTAAEWTPIGQFVLNRGVVSFPDVAAVGIKMEFTGLVAEPYEAFLPINRIVNRFAQSPVEAQGYPRDSVATAAIELLTANRFPDAIRQVFYGQDERINYVSPTTGLSVIDGTMRDQIGQQFGFGYTMASWQQKYRAPMNEMQGVHSYNVTEVQAISRTAFFVGLRTVEVRRARRRGVSDTKVYDDLLLDSDNLDEPTITMEFEPGQLYTPEAATSNIMTNPRSATSKPFFSRRPVTALQFATQQTGPIQVVPDDEFGSPGLVGSDFSNEDEWHKSGDSIIFWDANYGGVRISRNPSVLDAFYAPDTPIMHPPITPILSSGFGRIVTIDFDSFGGISSPTVSISPRGVLFAGARVSAVLSPLQADLKLRIYGSDGTTVLAEKAFRPEVDVPTECILPYVIGNTPGLDSGVQVRVEQDGPYMDSWVMHALSAFDTSILWEFSVDNGASWVPGYTARGLRYGVVDFPTPGTALRWRVVAYRHNSVIDAIRIRPWYMHRMGAAL